ncbi:hypothetical protein SCP_0504880 [Sparassis crispa]|uniref:SCD domain-containing protein n=1 Tax=Sparassis crispa TaxID=139825 RepID=A0A401GMP2_9APHY|nr:hypothetical protein SCP_0504880 [Sparassis crispa]GBE83439.1 hypothetical protein SCP_0504880 [Sparassis crispa]
MSDAEGVREPRRSQRQKKQVAHFAVNSTLTKRKRSDATDQDANSELSDSEDNDEGPDEEDDDAPKTKSPAKRKRKATGAPQAKKPRKTKMPAPKATAAKPKKTATRKAKQPAPDAEDFDAEKVAKDTKISGDNPLFNAIMNPAAALQSTVEDFLEAMVRTPGLSLAELINCVLRACGCNDSVNEDEVVDYDGVVDALDNFTEGLKKDDSPVYPLTSKLSVFKKFRKSLSEFLERLIASSAELGSLYTSDLMPTLQTWVVAMSSSQLRSFRHTATVIALEMETALCDVAAAVEKEAEVVGRQREGERKRKAAAVNKSKGGSAREKELEGKAAEVRQRRTTVAEFLKEFVDGVFVHRYRDLDASIRTECVRAMGLWFKKYPAHFLDGAYLRYVGWVLSDADTHVRLDAVRALALAYEQTAYIGAAALQHFTERFKPRLVQMAVGDTELSVRVAVVQVLQAIDGHGLLEDEQRERLCLLVFDEEARVRKAVSGFVRGVWEECLEERLVGKKPNAKDKQRAEVKALGMLLVKWGKTLDKTTEDVDTEDEDASVIDEGSSSRKRAKEVASLLSSGQKGRTALAVEALWDEMEPVSDWETLLDVLLLDHSAIGDDSSSQDRGSGGSGKQPTGVDEAWRLEEVEEAVLLEMFVAILRKAQADVANAKKGEDETVSSSMTRALIKGLPRLFVKHQTDENRIADVLLIPQVMNLDLYLEMRMMTAYASLWDDVTKQFLSHSHPVVLGNAVATIRYMMDATSLSNTNSTKILELEDELSTTLRDAISGRDEIEVASFSEDEVLSLGAICARLAALIGIRDLTSWMEEDEGGKQSSAWDILNALAERGRLGYKEEESMIDRALQVLTLHIIWKARGLTAPDVEQSPEEARFTERLREQRESLLEKLVEFAVGTQSNTSEGVRRAAFQNLMHLHTLFYPGASIAPDGSRLPTASLPLELGDEVQYRCAGFVQAEIEHYAEQLEELTPAHDGQNEENDASDSNESDSAVPAKKKNTGKGKQPAKGHSEGSRMTSRSQLEEEYTFIGVITTFLRAIRIGVIHFRHASILLAHYGRLGSMFDLCSKAIVDILREEGMYKNNGTDVVAVICQALRESFTLVLEGVVQTEEHSVALAKALTACLIMRGAQLSVVRRLDSKYVVEIHTALLSWIGKRLAACESAKNKKSRNKALLFFKVLHPLLVSIDNRDSLNIKAHLDQVLAQAKVEVLATAKAWESYRAYEKRLTASTAKEKGAAAKPKKVPKKGAKSAEKITTDAEEDEAVERPENVPRAPRLRPRPKPAYQPARAAEAATDGEPEATEDEDDPFLGSAVPNVATPSSRPRRKAASGSNSPRKSPSKSPSRLTSISEPLTPSPDENATPVASRKRGRSSDAEELEGTLDTLGDGEDSAAASPSAEPSLSQGTQATELQIRRKRIRH